MQFSDVFIMILKCFIGGSSNPSRIRDVSSWFVMVRDVLSWFVMFCHGS